MSYNPPRRLIKPSVLLACLSLILGLSLTAVPVLAAPAPDYGSVTIDGDVGDWGDLSSLTPFSAMYRAGQSSKKIETNLYLRYDCETKTMYALVYQADSTIPVLIQEQDAWIAIDSIGNKVVNGTSGDDGTPPDFQWIGEGYDGNGDHARGWEASFPLSEGTYKIIAHTNVFDDGGSQTSATVRGGADLEVTCSSIGDLVWFDINNNGVQDGSEPGIEDAVVALEDSEGGIITTTTNANGLYTFPDLNAGTYSVTVQSIPRPNYIFVSGIDPHPVTLPAGTVYTDADFGYGSLNVSLQPNNTGLAQPCDILTYTHTLTNLGTLTETFNLTVSSNQGFTPTLYVNGVQTTTVPDLGVFATADISVTVEVPCDATPGILDTTTITATSNRVPNLYDIARDYTDVYDTGGYITPTLEIDIPERPYSTTLYFVQNWVNTGSVEDRFNLTVFDIPENWGVRVYREDNPDTPNPTGVYSGTGALTTTNWFPVATYTSGDGVLDDNGDTITNDTGSDGIPDSGPLGQAGSLTDTTQVILEVTVPPNTVADSYTLRERASSHNDWQTKLVTTPTLTYNDDTVAHDEEFKTVDVEPTGTIGDYVWHDIDGDGIQDPNEPGLGGVELTLTGADGSVRTTTTDGDGNYDFVQLPRGRYTVTVNTGTLPAGFTLTGGTDPHTVCLCAGDDYTGADYNQADFGYQGSGSIGDRVWSDRDGDGSQDAGEPGIEGVTLSLTLESGDVVTTTTDSSGAYLFTGLFTGTYTVTVDTTTLPTGVSQTYDLDGMGTPHEATLNLTPGNLNRTDVDFGYQGTASLGDYVWIDSNGDGIQNSGDSDLPLGVTIAVWLLDELDNPILDGDGNPIGTTTDSNGLYTFTHLLPGTYVVQFDPPAGYVFTTQNATDDAADSDANPTSGKTGLIPLSANETITTVDAGLQVGLGGTVWHDLTHDSAYSPTTEIGISGVVVELYVLGDTPGTDSAMMTTTTDINGDYAFAGVESGTYFVAIPRTEIVGTYNNSSTGGNHDPTTTDDDQIGQGDDGIPNGEYIETQTFEFDGETPTVTLDFGFTNSPTAVRLSALNTLSRASYGWLAGIATVLTLSTVGLVSHRRRRRHR